MKITFSSMLAMNMCLFAFLLSPVTHAQNPQYTVTILGQLGFNNSQSEGISNSGEVVGYSYTSDGATQSGAEWIGTTPTGLGSLGGAYGNSATAINSLGEVVGYSTTPSNQLDAVAWTGVTPKVLGSIAGYSTEAEGVNASGQIVGWSDSQPEADPIAVAWTGVTPKVLGSLDGGSSEAEGVNASGQIVGWSYDLNGNQAAVRWTGTTPTTLGAIGNNSQALGINTSGQIVGFSGTANVNEDAVKWTGTTPHILGSLGGTYSQANSINDSGEIVGLSYTAENVNQDGFLYVNGTMYDLNSFVAPDSGIFISDAEGIADNGDIAASGDYDGNLVAILLTPDEVPEPSLLSLSLFGIVALIFLRNNRRSSPALNTR